MDHILNRYGFNFLNSCEYITVNGPSDLMEFRKAVLRRVHCELKAVSVMKLNFNIKFDKQCVCSLF